MNHDTVAHYLTTHTDAVYNAFNARIVATSMPTIGVRIPYLRALAKEIERSGWGLATGVAKEGEKTLDALASGRYSPAVVRRAVRKSCESLRVSIEDKIYLKSLLK